MRPKYVSVGEKILDWDTGRVVKLPKEPVQVLVLTSAGKQMMWTWMEGNERAWSGNRPHGRRASSKGYW